MPRETKASIRAELTAQITSKNEEISRLSGQVRELTSRIAYIGGQREQARTNLLLLTTATCVSPDAAKATHTAYQEVSRAHAGWDETSKMTWRQMSEVDRRGWQYVAGAAKGTI